MKTNLTPATQTFMPEGKLLFTQQNYSRTKNVDALIRAMDDQIILEGDIIVFEKDDRKVVHRVIKVKNINNQTRYFTKGDANENIDVGFISDADILGILDLKISYIGYPTLWIRDVFSR